MKSCVVLFAVDFLGRSRMKKIWWITTNATEKIWWNNFWYLYPDINFVIDGTKWDFFLSCLESKIIENYFNALVRVVIFSCVR